MSRNGMWTNAAKKHNCYNNSCEVIYEKNGLMVTTCSLRNIRDDAKVVVQMIERIGLKFVGELYEQAIESGNIWFINEYVDSYLLKNPYEVWCDGKQVFSNKVIEEEYK